jgi:hypothetical protein
MSFGQHHQTLGAAAGLSRAGLARRAGVPVGTLCNGEADRGFPWPGPPACGWLRAWA